jgi:uncharacterized protein YndB with AHSA1/START domain
LSDADADAEFGTLERADGVSILRYERRLAHPRALVWRALTEDADLAGWFPTTIEGQRRAGAELRFSFRQGEGQPFDGEMLVFVPPSLMELRWADDILRFELQDAPGPGGPACILRLRVTFPEHGKAARDAAGWHVCLERMTALCNGTAPSWEPSERWQVVHRLYVERLGPEASVIGPTELLRQAAEAPRTRSSRRHL